jgi:NADH:ubiquinone oxidoreductase subunit 6 (subunit J)
MRQFMVRSREYLHYMEDMDVLQIVLVVFMAGALGAVIIGVIAMAVNGKLNKNHSNKLMRLRVLFQAIAVLVFVIIIWLSRN